MQTPEIYYAAAAVVPSSVVGRKPRQCLRKASSSVPSTTPLRTSRKGCTVVLFRRKRRGASRGRFELTACASLILGSAANGTTIPELVEVPFQGNRVCGWLSLVRPETFSGAGGETLGEHGREAMRSNTSVSQAIGSTSFNSQHEKMRVGTWLTTMTGRGQVIRTFAHWATGIALKLAGSHAFNRPISETCLGSA